jgi:hypothetical protein
MIPAMQHKEAEDLYKHSVQPLLGIFMCSPMLREIPLKVILHLYKNN